MTFTIPFDPGRYRKHARINFQSSWKKPLWFFRGLLAAAILLTFFYVFFPPKDDVPILADFCLLLFAWAYLSGRIYYRAKKSYNTALYESLNNPQVWNSNLVIAVTDESIYYKTYNTEMTLQWSSFARYRHIQQVLFIDSKLGFTIMIGEDEITQSEFNALKEVITKKLRNV